MTGDTLSHVRLVCLSGDTLSVLDHDSTRLIPVASLSEVRLVKEAAVWETAKQYGLIAGITGGVVSGIAIATSAHGGSFYSLGLTNTSARILGVLLGVPFYGAASALLGGGVGCVVGGIKGADEVYDLSHGTLKGKISIIREILSRPPSDGD